MENGEKPVTIAIVPGYYRTSPTAFPHFLTNLPSICSVSIAYNSKSNVNSVCDADFSSKIYIFSNKVKSQKTGYYRDSMVTGAEHRLANCFSIFLNECTLYRFISTAYTSKNNKNRVCDADFSSKIHIFSNKVKWRKTGYYRDSNRC